MVQASLKMGQSDGSIEANFGGSCSPFDPAAIRPERSEASHASSFCAKVPHLFYGLGCGFTACRLKFEIFYFKFKLLENRLAEKVRFELTVPVKVQRFSRPSRSTTLAPLRGTRGYSIRNLKGKRRREIARNRLFGGPGNGCGQPSGVAVAVTLRRSQDSGFGSIRSLSNALTGFSPLMGDCGRSAPSRLR